MRNPLDVESEMLQNSEQSQRLLNSLVPPKWDCRKRAEISTGQIIQRTNYSMDQTVFKFRLGDYNGQTGWSQDLINKSSEHAEK